MTLRWMPRIRMGWFIEQHQNYDAASGPGACTMPFVFTKRSRSNVFVRDRLLGIGVFPFSAAR